MPEPIPTVPTLTDGHANDAAGGGVDTLRGSRTSARGDLRICPLGKAFGAYSVRVVQSHHNCPSTSPDRSAREKVLCALHKSLKWLLARTLAVSDCFRRP